MRNQRPNFIPVPTKPARNIPKSLSSPTNQKKSSGVQTDRVVLVKEENLAISWNKLGQNDGGMRRDYIKAINYVNACHKFINNIAEKNASDKNEIFKLPVATNFAPLFQQLIGRSPAKPAKKAIPSNQFKRGGIERARGDDKRSKASAEIKKKLQRVITESEPEPEPIPVLVGDCEENVHLHESGRLRETDLPQDWKDRIKDFWTYLEERIKKSDKETALKNPPFKNLDEFKGALSKLYKISQSNDWKESVRNIQLPQNPAPPPFIENKESTDDCSVIASDTDCKRPDLNFKSEMHTIEPSCYKKSAFSFLSEPSEIKSDSESDIHKFI